MYQAVVLVPRVPALSSFKVGEHGAKRLPYSFQLLVLHGGKKSLKYVIFNNYLFENQSDIYICIVLHFGLPLT